MMKEKKKFQPLTLKDVCNIYKILYKHKIVSFPLEEFSIKRVDSLVANINGSYFGTEIYKSFEEKAVAYLYFVIKDHPFTDGNKRAGCLIFAVLCDLNELEPEYKDFTLDELAVLVEQYRGTDHQQFIKALVKLLFD